MTRMQTILLNFQADVCIEHKMNTEIKQKKKNVSYSTKLKALFTLGKQNEDLMHSYRKQVSSFLKGVCLQHTFIHSVM